jgi:hypothetical protein
MPNNGLLMLPQRSCQMHRWRKVTIDVTAEDIANGQKYVDNPVAIAMKRRFNAKSVRILFNGHTQISRKTGGMQRQVIVPPSVCSRINRYNGIGEMEPFSFTLNIKYDSAAKHFP